MDPNRLQTFFLQMIPFLMAIVGHEYGHAIMAKRFGDTTAKDMGRLTLNPLPHLDPIGTILFPAINMLTGMSLLIGWAKPVPINYNRLKPFKKGLFLVALAGPGANFIMAFVAAFFVLAIQVFVPPTFYLATPLRGMSEFAISINFALGIFNLIPLPPLDGARAIQAFMSYETSQKFDRFGMYSFFILLALLWSGILNYLGIPIQIMSFLTLKFWSMIFSVLGLVG